MSINTTIILINYNNHADTLKCLASISAAGYHNDVVVVDNHSTSPGIEEITEKFPNTVLIKNKENIGFGRANNIGIEWALKNTNSKFFFILNNDTTIEKGTIQNLEKVLLEDNDVGIATPKIVMMEEPNLLWYGGGTIDWKKGSAKLPGYMEASSNKLAGTSRNVEFASGCAMLVSRYVIEKIGGFDKRFFMYEEDLEFCFRVIQHGRKIWYSSNSVVYHKGQGSLRDEKDSFKAIWSPENPNLPFYMFQITKNRFLNMYMHAKGINRVEFFVFFPCILLLKSLQFLYYWRIDGIKAISSGIKAFWIEKNNIVDEKR
jgi:GT2 family glycosyltransferase